VFEHPEMFTLALTSTDPVVIVNPSSITIEDDDRELQRCTTGSSYKEREQLQLVSPNLAFY